MILTYVQSLGDKKEALTNPLYLYLPTCRSVIKAVSSICVLRLHPIGGSTEIKPFKEKLWREFESTRESNAP